MQNFVRKPSIKIAAFVLSVITLVFSVLGIMGFVICASEDFYSYTVLTDVGPIHSGIVSRIYRNEVISTVRSYNYGTDLFRSEYSPSKTNLRVSVQEMADGKFGAETFSYDPEEETPISQKAYYVVEQLDTYGNHSYYDWSEDSSIFLEYGAEENPESDASETANAEQGITEPQLTHRDYVVKIGTASTPLVRDQITILTSMFSTLYQIRFALIWITAGAVVLGLISHLVLLAGVGRRVGEETVHPGWQEKIPLDLYLAVSVTAIVCAVYFLAEIFYMLFYQNVELMMALPCLGIVLTAAAVLLDMLLGTLATRLKMGKWWRNCLIWKFCAWAWKWAVHAWNAVFGRIFRAVGSFFRMLPMVWQGVIATGIILFAEVFLTFCMDSGGFGVLLWFVFNLAVVFGATFLLAQMRRLAHTGEKMAAGDLDYRVETEGMIPAFKEHGENLNAIGEGMSHAVDQRMRSERMKTELITNVSHDIKTPLTSIVNYVDLLSKEEEGNERVQEYISALQRQSSRLRKLIEDLVEASKASTGSLSVDLQPCELGVLLEQTAGEYEDRLKGQGLTLVVEAPQEPVMVMADSRHIWRVLDNLMGNICKYALSGTRVYMSLVKKEEAVLTLRNISRDQLNISEEELMERFVRGDSSRSTEGSGLGLSIARSLLELQHGRLEIQVDGDLFKVILHMPLMDGKKPPEGMDQPDLQPHLEITPLEMPVQRDAERRQFSGMDAQREEPAARPMDPRLSWNTPKRDTTKAYLRPNRPETAPKESGRLKKMAKSPAKWMYGKLKFIVESEEE